jgi:hypothetical protein
MRPTDLAGGKDLSTQHAPHDVHLVGSIGLDTVDEVFCTVGRVLGRRVKRIPDGEPGSRRLWVSFQYPLLRSSAFLRPDPSGKVRKTNGFPLLCLAEGVSPDEINFGELGYAREARASYTDFLAARTKRAIPSGVKFQVCLPTPMAVTYAFCTERDVVAIDRAYEAAMIREVEAICAAIPHHDLSLQWDFCHEMLILDGQPQDQFPLVDASLEHIMARMQRLCTPIPRSVDLGIHLCYGDFGAKHILEPVDAARMVEVANALVTAIKRPLTYIHFPIPIAWNEDRYYRPFDRLRLAPETAVYLGVVHLADGPGATQKRIAIARKFVPEFGIATECGIARARKKDVVERTLALHAQVASEPVA